MSLGKIYSLRSEAESNPCKATYEALVQEEVTFLDQQQQRLRAAEERRQSAERRKAELLSSINHLKARQSGSGQEVSSAQVSPSSKSAHGQLTPTQCDDYREEYVRLLKDFTQRKHILTYFLSYSASDLKSADLSVVSRWLDTWMPFFTEADDSCRELKYTERGATNAHLIPPAKELSKVLDDMCRLQLQARSVVGRERYRRSTFSDNTVDDFLENQGQLYDWCQKQLTTLKSLSSFSDLAEFSRGFHANVPVMDSNFLVLMDQYELLSNSPKAQAAMKEVNEAWVELSHATFERLRRAARDEHRQSALEDLCASWAQGLGPRVQALLSNAIDVLQNKNGQLSSSTDAKSLASRCEKILNDHGAHQIVCVHLADYDVREDCIQPHLDALKRELLSAMTSTVMSLSCAGEYEGRQEFRSRVDELREWIDVKSQKGTYEKLLERLDNTKLMVEESADALFPDDEK